MSWSNIHVVSLSLCYKKGIVYIWAVKDEYGNQSSMKGVGKSSIVIEFIEIET